MTEVRIPVRGKDVNATVVIDTDDIEYLDITSSPGFDTNMSERGIVRTPNGENRLTVVFKFKNGKKELWVESRDPQEEEKP